MKFFKNISNRGYLDPLKLKTIILDIFKEFGEKIWQVIQKIFGHFKMRIGINQYIECVEKFINIGHKKCKQILFNLFNLNKDQFIDEKEVFEIVSKMKSLESNLIFWQDLQKVSKEVQYIRSELNK